MSAKHWGVRDGEHIRLDFWLIVHPGEFGAWNQRPSVRVTAGEPNLTRHERAMNLKIKLPVALFKAPALSANIEVESPAQQIEIDASAVAEAVRQVIGMDVDIQVNAGGDNDDHE
jgi:hypothetical protein